MTLERTAVVTGANGGIGFAAARGLAAAGFRLVMVARTAARAAAAAERLRLVAPQATVLSESADFASLPEVAGLARRLHERLPQIDLLVNNAGLFSQEQRLSADGYELTFAVNFLAPFLLTTRLLDRLHAAPQAQVINVSSAAYRSGRLQLDRVIAPPRYSGITAYGTSKLALNLFTRELSSRLAGTRTRANCLHPGFVDTAINQGSAGWFGLLMRFASRFAVDAAHGADGILYLAVDPAAAALNGAYLHELRVQRQRGQAADSALGRRLWQTAQEYCDRALTARTVV
jgi:NAD(P)-dependent dehydrogenase (short-subunit alcohol dehydrogenase family)